MHGTMTIGTTVVLTLEFISILLYRDAFGVDLSPRYVDHWEYSDVTLICKNSNKTMTIVVWHRQSRVNTFAAMNNNCELSSFLNHSLFSAYCDETQYALTIKNISAEQHLNNWTCELFSERLLSNVVTIRVKVKLQAISIFPTSSKISSAENESVALRCQSSSCRPEPKFEWRIDNNTLSLDDDILLSIQNESSTTAEIIQPYSSSYIFKPSRAFNGLYVFCVAANYKNDFVISNKIFLDVSYPPKIDVLKDKTILEGEDLDYMCDFTDGNPSVTNITWSWTGGSWNGKQLQITNTSRNHRGLYRCTVQNAMTSSDDIQKNWTDSRTFNLFVQYKSRVLEIIINDHDNDNVTVNENDEVNITCKIEGDPSPTGDLFRQSFRYYSNNQTESLLSYTTVQNLTFLRLTHQFTAQCTHTGIHTCLGKNIIHTGEETTSLKSLSLFVNCSPRLSPSFNVQQNVTSALNVSATFGFITMAYPHPKVQWYRILNESETSDASGGIIANYNISTNEMQTNFTITAVKETHYGEYLLEIENQYGSFRQTFYLVSQGIPIPPQVYGYYPDSVSTNSVVIYWEPGFDGGFPQSFIISYNLTASKWYNETAILHNKEHRMNSTITELASGSEYHVLLYAQNEKELYTTTIKTLTTSYIVGPAVGGAVGGLLAVITVTILIIKKRTMGTRTRAAEKELNQNDGYSTIDGAGISYEKLEHTGSEADKQYQQLANLRETEQKYGPSRKVYENLQLSLQKNENNMGESSESCENPSIYSETLSCV